MARVSVIIPTHNRVRMLQRAIDSAKSAGGDVEVIVVDDASSDATRSICKQRNDIIYVRLDRNMGPAHARNVGIRHSSADFVAFLDDDDWRLPGSLDKQAALLARDEDLGFVYGQVLVGDTESGAPTGEIRPPSCPSGDIFWRLLRGNFIFVASVLVRKRHFSELGLFDANIKGTEDWDAWIRLAERHAVDVLPEPVAIYRGYHRASGQISSSRPRMCRSSAYTIEKALRSERVRDADPALRRAIADDYRNFLWDYLVDEARGAMTRGDFRYAVSNYATALQLHPRRALGRFAVKRVLRKLGGAARRG